MGFLQKLLEAIFGGGNKKSKGGKRTTTTTGSHKPKPTNPTPPSPTVPPVAKEKSSDELAAEQEKHTPPVVETPTPAVVENETSNENSSEEEEIVTEEVETVEVEEIVAEEAETVVEEVTVEEVIPPVVVEHPEAEVSAQLIDHAKKYIGTPYLFGGTTTAGFDCSGFVGQAFEDIGMDLPRTSRQQAELGQKIDLSEVQTGDLVFFSHSGSRIDHVGIITSKKGEPMTMIHASTSKGVIISDLENSTYWKPRITHAQRILA